MRVGNTSNFTKNMEIYKVYLEIDQKIHTMIIWFALCNTFDPLLALKQKNIVNYSLWRIRRRL